MPAKIGIRNLCFCQMTNEETETYSPNVVRIGETTEFKIEPQSNTAELYADDALSESSTIVNKANISITVKDMSQTVQAMLFGHAVDTVNGGLITKNTDISPFGALYGEITMSDGTYRPFWLTKVKFTEPNDENTTKSENIEYKTVSASGTAYTRKRDNVMKHSLSSADPLYNAVTYKAAPYELPSVVHVTSIALNKSTATLAVDATEELTITWTPSTATNKDVMWFSTDTSKATVDQTGKVTALADGEATIVAVTNDGNKTANCVVTIS